VKASPCPAAPLKSGQVQKPPATSRSRRKWDIPWEYWWDNGIYMI
jgi:hypothetical protein